MEIKERRLAEAQAQEIKLRGRQRELEDKERALELELGRRLDEARLKLHEQFAREFEDRTRLKESEHHEQIAMLRRQIDELKRKAEQGSQQVQGEVLEIEMEELLRAEFPFDAVEPVAKGTRGGDILQTVKTQSGRECGRILWEFKRTKQFSESWIDKLRDDQREARADIAVLVSETLPRGLHHFREIRGVWVTDVPSALSLALALRVILIQVANERRTQEGKSGKMEEIYRYLTGPEFRNRVTAIVEAFSLMKNELEAEKRAMQKIWAKRERQIQRVLDNTVCLHGDLEAIAGNALPAIKVLDRPSAKPSRSSSSKRSAPCLFSTTSKRSWA
jgi:hypothetical protein